MATCPRCGSFLTDGHRCFGAWREFGRFTVVAIVGAALGLLVSFVGFERPTDSLVVVVGLLGAVLATAVWRSLRW